MVSTRLNGKPKFPNIDGVVYFSYRIRSKNEGLPFWCPGTLAKNDPMMSEFKDKLRSGWFAYLSRITQQQVTELYPHER